MILPNADKAVIPIEKLRDYVLNTSHKTGGHKALVFASVLGWGRKDASKLQKMLLDIVQNHEANTHYEDEFGIHYRIDFTVKERGKTVILRSIWLVKRSENFPRLSTCYIR